MNIDRAKDALLIVDLQPDFMPGGALPVAGGEKIVPGIVRLMEEFDVIVATQDWHPYNHISFASVQKVPPFSGIELYGKPQTIWPDHCIQGSIGADLHPGLTDHRITMKLRKGMNWRVDSYSAFRENFGPNGIREETGLAGFLYSRKIRGLFLVGLARDVCVLWTAKDAGIGFKTRVVWDLTRSVNPENDVNTRKEFLESGVEIV